MSWPCSIGKRSSDSLLKISISFWRLLSLFDLFLWLLSKSSDFGHESFKPVLKAYMYKIKSLAEILSQSGLARPWLTDQENLMSRGSCIINEILLGTCQEVIINYALRRDVLIEWTLHHFNKGLLWECLSDTLGI